jgi:NACHT domain
LLFLGRSGSGKSVLLRYLVLTTGKRSLDGTESKLPLLLDLRTTPIAGQSVEAFIRGALTGGGVELPPTILDFLIHKGRFLRLIDSLNEVQDVTALKNILHMFLNQDAYNWVVMVSQLDLLGRSDMLRYRLQQVTL